MFSGKSKLSDKWEKDPYVVIEKPISDIPVYRVRKESGSGKVRTLHRNLLLPFMCITRSDFTENPVRKQKQKGSMQVDENSDSDSDDPGIIWSRKCRNRDVPENNRNFSESSSFGTSVSSEESGPRTSSVTESRHSTLHSPTVVEPRRSTRERKPPDRYGTWVSPQNAQIWYV